MKKKKKGIILRSPRGPIGPQKPVFRMYPVIRRFKIRTSCLLFRVLCMLNVAMLKLLQVHQKLYTEGGLLVGLYDWSHFTRSQIDCSRAREMLICFFSSISREANHLESYSPCKLPCYVSSGSDHGEAITTIHVLNVSFFSLQMQASWFKFKCVACPVCKNRNLL